MPKNIDDIIIVDKKRSIRDIPIPEGRRRDSQYVPPTTPVVPPVTPVYTSPITSRDNSDVLREKENKNFSKPPRRKSVWIGAGLAIIVLIFAILSIFNGATLAYVPKSAPISFDKDVYTAEKTGEGKLLYSVVKLSKDKGLDVSASGEEQVSRKASGTIVVYNNATTEPQRLVATTRFETTGGLVYRAPKDFVIPGKKIVAGVSQPGSIEIVVFADVAGEKYNVGLSDFTLPGLKGGTRYTTIYARSKTVMSGGFVGVEKVVSSQDETAAKTQLETTLRDELTSEVKAQVPEDFILFPSLSSVTIEDLPQTESSSKDKVMVNMRANLYGVMFKRSDLSTNLASKKITLTQGDLIDITALDSLDLAFVDIAPADLLLSNEIKFSVTGQVSALWQTDEVALKADLVGRGKKEILSILNNYPTIVSATATIRPFWKTSFPDDGASITVKKLPVE